MVFNVTLFSKNKTLTKNRFFSLCHYLTFTIL
jgi:hypothetical protein